MSNVNHPSHYNQGKVECLDAIESMVTNSPLSPFCDVLRYAIMKYIWRLGRKNTVIEDAKKARWYLDKLIEKLEEDNKDVSC
jgi:hypothetical protein